MKKLAQNRPHIIGVSLVKQPRCQRMDAAVARVAKRHEVIKRVVPAVPFMPKACAVNVMNVRSVIVAALAARKTVALQGLQMVPIAVLGDQSSKVRASRRTVEGARAFAFAGRSANVAGKFNAAVRARFGTCIARVIRLAAAVAGLGVEFGFRVLVPRLTRAATNLSRVINAKFSIALDALSDCSRCFHINVLTRGCV
jgi:hypothetical protein